MKRNCENPDLCPRNVYEELGACAQCCNCFPLAERTIQEAAIRFVASSHSANDTALPTIPIVVQESR